VEVKPEFKSMFMGEIPPTNEYIEWRQSLFDFEDTVKEIEEGINQCLENGDDLYCFFDVIDNCCILINDDDLHPIHIDNYNETSAIQNYYTYKIVKEAGKEKLVPIDKIFTIELFYTLKGSLDDGEVDILTYKITKH
jgi:hypothetical protein